MTPLTKPVTRVVDFGRGPIAITMHPEGILTFREKGRKRIFAVPMARAFVEAVGRAVTAEKEARKMARRANKR